ncbi:MULTISPECIES: DUF5681 domain-containing protein [Bradyrhizobium]|uniref:DUF5681 domain-containing protein n=1 Tax=Bradyrhizobium TaxID=374 RepID=UPI0004AEC92B|nr:MULTISPECIES: DUF5681 domain-containing protein [Bradyrhizobium]MBR1367212.1 hypothetical protein [Bradyrhizobium ottawaense]BBO07658.1 hypothetical protein SG09_70080 [Bradyrhizobium ottawaense]GMO32609.1 hypothetical protein BwSF21_36360 [Bradyrhizobium ottawaense]GMO77998.1 hypothetical protein BwSG20_53200 [Bradyrhizobium ottawaense]
MSRRKQSGLPTAEGNQGDGVGYGRPPREHQFKPGQSGNKKGRPRGSKNEATLINEILDRKIPIRDNGKARTITVLEGILTKAAEDALKGKDKAAAFLLNRKQQVESSEQPAAPQLDIDDRKVLDAYADQLREQFKKQGDSE